MTVEPMREFLTGEDAAAEPPSNERRLSSRAAPRRRAKPLLYVVYLHHECEDHWDGMWLFRSLDKEEANTWADKMRLELTAQNYALTLTVACDTPGDWEKWNETVENVTRRDDLLSPEEEDY